MASALHFGSGDAVLGNDANRVVFWEVGVMDDLTVSVRFVDEPALWSWEIRDGVNGRVVATSWSSEWMGYDSPDEALRAGRQRVADGPAPR